MSVHSVRAGINSIGAGFIVAVALLLPTASHAQNDGSIEAMMRSSNPNYGSVASPATVTRIARPKAQPSTAEARPQARAASRQAKSEARSEPTRRTSRGVQVASLGGGASSPAPRQRSLGGGGGINWIASSSCLNGTLRGIVSHVAANFGAVTVNSTCRSSERNRSVGGAPKSFHLSGDAVDFRVHGNVSGAVAYLSGRSGGYKHMGGGLFHVDTGPTRRF
jgi:hypothetical protein